MESYLSTQSSSMALLALMTTITLSKLEQTSSTRSQSLANAGYSMNDELVKMYTGYCSERAAITMQTFQVGAFVRSFR